ncbi:MAG: hypothetical protein D6693_02700 [Planctomycetota bacterium]|nr:MAG: hypothetical protein D6693_02700 [Planctomycetota bacterium]
MESHTDDPRPAAGGARTEAPDDASPRVRCILALPDRARATPADLAEAFAARSIEVRETVGPFRAMAEVMLARRDERCAVALVVVDPEEGRTRCDELMRAAGRWCPRVARWVYDGTKSPRLSRWADREEDAPAAGVNGIAGAIREVTGAPTLRLIGAEDVATPAAGAGDPTPARDEPAAPASELTEDEIAMLLGFDADAPRDDGAGRAGP